MDILTLKPKFWRLLAPQKTVGQMMQTKYFLDGCLTHVYIYTFWNILYKGLSLVRGDGAHPSPLFSRETTKIPHSQDQNYTD